MKKKKGKINKYITSEKPQLKLDQWKQWNE